MTQEMKATAAKAMGRKRFGRVAIAVIFTILLVALLLLIGSQYQQFEARRQSSAQLEEEFESLQAQVLNLRQAEAERKEKNTHIADVKQMLTSYLQACRAVEDMPLHELPLVYWIQGANGSLDHPVYYLSLPAGSHSLSIECQLKKPDSQSASLADDPSPPAPEPVIVSKRELKLGPGNYRLSIICQEKKPVQVTMEFAQDGEWVGTWAVDFPIEGLQATSHGQSSQNTIDYYRPAPIRDGVINIAFLGAPRGLQHSWGNQERIVEVRLRGQLGIETP